MRVSSTLPVQPAGLLPSSNLQKAPEKRTSSCTCHCTLGGPVPSSSARYTTTDVSCRMRGGPTVILYSNIQKGELRKSEAAPVFKVYACQPLSTTGTLTHKGPSQKPVSSKFPNEIPLTIAYPQRNIHHPPLETPPPQNTQKLLPRMLTATQWFFQGRPKDRRQKFWKSTSSLPVTSLAQS